MDRRKFFTAAGAGVAVAAVASATPAFASAPASSLVPGREISKAASKHKPHPYVNKLNKVFKEAEAVVEWPKGYYHDVYTRIADLSQQLFDATSAQINPQLSRDAQILHNQALAMLNEEDQFETENRPAQLENRYTRVDMQLWRDRLAFDLKNPFNDEKATAGISAAPQKPLPANLEDFKVYSDNAGKFSIDFTVIPTGTYQMGGTPEEWASHNVDSYRAAWETPQHPVTIRRRFGIMPTEVNRAMFRQFVAETGYAMPAGGVGFPAPPETMDPTSSMYREGVTWENPGIPQDSDQHPVVQVSRADAQAFARWVSVKTGQNWRLPTEAEWEYAARAGTQTAYFWGEDINDGSEYAAGYDIRSDEVTGYGFPDRMEADDHAAYTAEIGSYKPNPWGLYDVTGNAREWVADYWEPNLESGPYTEEARTAGVAEFPVLRGGGWDYMPQNLRIAYRSAYYNNYIHSNMWGFRLVRDI